MSNNSDSKASDNSAYLDSSNSSDTFILSFPFVALFMFLLHGLLDIYLRDPLLKMLGIIG